MVNKTVLKRKTILCSSGSRHFTSGNAGAFPFTHDQDHPFEPRSNCTTEVIEPQAACVGRYGALPKHLLLSDLTKIWDIFPYMSKPSILFHSWSSVGGIYLYTYPGYRQNISVQPEWQTVPPPLSPRVECSPLFRNPETFIFKTNTSIEKKNTSKL